MQPAGAPFGAQRARSTTTDESLLSEGVATEAAWPRSQTADGGREIRISNLLACGAP